MENFETQQRDSGLEKKTSPEILKKLRINKALFGLSMMALVFTTRAEGVNGSSNELTSEIAIEESGDSFSSYKNLEDIPDGEGKDIVAYIEGAQIVGVDNESNDIYEVLYNQFIIDENGDPIFIDRRTGEKFPEERQKGKKEILKSMVDFNIESGVERIEKIEIKEDLGLDEEQRDLESNEKQPEIKVEDLSDAEKDYCILTKELWDKSFEVTQLENREVKAESSKEKSEIRYELRSAKVELRELREKHQELKNNPEIKEELKKGRIARDLAEQIK